MLLEIFQWEDLSSLENRQKELKEKVSDEVADIMLYLLRFSDLAEIDLEIRFKNAREALKCLNSKPKYKYFLFSIIEFNDE